MLVAPNLLIFGLNTVFMFIIFQFNLGPICITCPKPPTRVTVMARTVPELFFTVPRSVRRWHSTLFRFFFLSWQNLAQLPTLCSFKKQAKNRVDNLTLVRGSSQKHLLASSNYSFCIVRYCCPLTGV